MSSLNITLGRAKVLQAVQCTPGLYARGIAYLFPRSSENCPDIGWSAQGAVSLA